MIENSTALKKDFCLKYVYLNKGKKNEVKEKNPLSYENQIILIDKILKNIYNVVIDGRKEFLLSIGDGNIMHLDRLLVNFRVNLNLVFRELTIKQFETINLSKLFEFIKSRPRYSYRESFSFFHKQNRIVVKNKDNEIINEKKIDYDFQGAKIEKSIYDEIVLSINGHWKELIPLLLDYIIAGKYATDKKSLWLLIMADSNFGKSKLFKWMEGFGGSSFVKYADIMGNGISDKDPKEFFGKLCLVVDEVLSFARKLYEVEEFLSIRPMRNHTVKIPVGSKILLSADGGTFNASYQDDQTKNRVSVIDLRGTNTKELGELEVTNKFGEYTIAKTMEHWLSVQLLGKITEYEKLSLSEKSNKAENLIKYITAKYKIKSKNFFERMEEVIYEILDNDESLDSFHKSILEGALIRVDNRDKRGYIIKRPDTVIPQIVSHYDKTLKYELDFKDISQIVNKIETFSKPENGINVDGKKHRGVFVADRPEKIELVYENIDKDTGALLDKDGKEIF